MDSDPINVEILTAGFREFLLPGDSLIVHSSLRSVGWVEGGPDAVIDAMLEAIGPAGNLMLPAFNYTRPLPDPCYDPAETPCRTGIIPETGRKRGDALRSLSPTHSVAVIGPRAEELTAGHLETRTFGVDSPLDRLIDLSGRILMLGVGQTSNSALHVAEEHAQRPKAPWEDGELPLVKIRMPNGEMIDHQIDTSPSCSAGFGAAEPVLRTAGAIKDVQVGNAKCQLVDGKLLRSSILQLIQEDPEALLCHDSECPCCVGTRRLLNS